MDKDETVKALHDARQLMQDIYISMNDPAVTEQTRIANDALRELLFLVKMA